MKRDAPARARFALLLALPLAALLETRIRFVFDGIFLACAFLIAIDRTIPHPAMRLHDSQKWLLLYIAVAGIATMRGIALGSVQDASSALPTLARTVELLLIPTLAFTTIARESRAFRLALFSSLAIFIFYAVFIIADSWVHHVPGTPEHQLAERAAGTLSAMVPVVALAALATRRKLLLAGALGLAFVLFCSGSRAALAAAAAGTCAAIAIHPAIKPRAKAMTAAIIALVFVLLLSRHALDGLRTLLFAPPSPLEYGRFWSWKKALNEFMTAPLLGVGVGAEPRVFYDGDWVRLLHETGVAGLFAAAGFIASLGRALWVRRIDWPAAGLFGTLIALCARSIFGSPFLRASDGLLFYLVGALTIHRDLYSSPSSSHNSSNTPPAVEG